MSEFILDVPPRQQASPMSCWWACSQMLLEYYGRGSFARPWNFSIAFERPLRARAHYGPELYYPPAGARRRTCLLGTDIPLPIVAPYEWYDQGVPPTDSHLEMLCELTGLSPLRDRPAFGSWSPEIVEAKLRAYGPFMFIGNWNRQGFHAVLVNGRRSLAGSSGSSDDIVYVDPAGGVEISADPETFNDRMSSAGLSPMNPFYLPAPPQVRAVRS